MNIPSRAVRIWDLPTRLFHWAFAALLLAAWISGQFGGSDWREWHMRAGFGVLALLIFRVMWGFAGDRYAAFASFPLSIGAAGRYLRTGGRAAGHSPLAAFSVYALLGAAALQVGTGLMTADELVNEGPWVKLASDRTVSLMTSIHAINRWILLALVLLHLAAIAWYSVRGENLLRPMIDGNQRGLVATAADDGTVIRLRGMLLALLAIVLTSVLVTL
ncbi:MAG: cytochrome b/b6 domain-containing protein [Burkholderiaceae bacterium]